MNADQLGHLANYAFLVENREDEATGVADIDALIAYARFEAFKSGADLSIVED